MEYQLAKFFHVLLAIIAVGFNASYGIWLACASESAAGDAEPRLAHHQVPRRPLRESGLCPAAGQRAVQWS